MVVMMQKIVSIKTKGNEELTSDERNLLSVAYKNVVGAKRSSWRMLNDGDSIISSEDGPSEELLNGYKKIVEMELKEICEQVLQELETLQEQNRLRITKTNDEALLGPL